MNVEEFQERAQEYIDDITGLINNNMPDKGLKCCDSQKICLVCALNEFEHCVNGVEQEDFIENDAYGVFVYRRGKDDREEADEHEDDDSYFDSEKKAILHAESLADDCYPVDEYFIEVWLKDGEGLYGNAGEAIWSNWEE